MALATRVVSSHPAWAVPVEEPPDDLLDSAGPLDGAHVLVIGPASPETFVGLIRRGAATAVQVRRDDHSSALADADVAILPRCTSLTDAATALTLARRVLSLGGRVVLRDGGVGRSQALARLMVVQGFASIRCRVRPSGAVLTGDLPFFGPIRAC